MKFRAILSATLLSAGIAQAAPVSTAIGNVNVLGTNYAVSLLYDSDHNTGLQSFNALQPSITFTNSADSFAAATALVNTFGTGYNFNPGGANGVRIVYGVTDINYQYHSIFTGSVFGPFDRLKDGGNTFSFAQFSAVTAVPEPENYAMMMLGLAVVGLARRQRKA
jgi:hypothetical protein